MMHCESLYSLSLQGEILIVKVARHPDLPEVLVDVVPKHLHVHAIGPVLGQLHRDPRRHLLPELGGVPGTVKYN